MANHNFHILFPPGMLAVAACLFLLFANYGRQSTVLWPRICLSVFLAVAAAALAIGPPADSLQEGSHFVLSSDRPASALAWAGLTIGACFAAMKTGGSSRAPNPAEMFAMLLLAVAGTMVAVRAQELVLLSVGLQLAVLPLGLVIFFSGSGRRSREAALKYVVAHALSTGLLVYGLVLCYGVAGTTSLAQSGVWSQAGPAPSLLGISAAVLAVSGLAVQLSAAPFHYFAVDVAEGTDAWTAGLVATLPKIAAAGVLLRIGQTPHVWQIDSAIFVLLLLAVVSIVSGNLSALLQNRLHRIITSLGVAQAGYLLLGVAGVIWRSGENGGGEFHGAVAGSIGQLIGWTICITCLFCALAYLSTARRRVEYVDELAGLAQREPWLACSLSVSLLSLSGIVPLWGFWSRAAICLPAMRISVETDSSETGLHAGFLTAALVALFGGFPAAATAVRLMRLMYLRDPLGKLTPSPDRSAKITAIVLSAATVLGGIAALIAVS